MFRKLYTWCYLCFIISIVLISIINQWAQPSRCILIWLFKVILAQSSMFWHPKTMKHSTGLLQFQGFRKWHLGSILTIKKWVFYRYFFRKRQLFRGKTVEYLTFTEESLYFMQQLINLCYCKSFWRNSNPKV